MATERIKVYVWEIPVRATHWINFLCVLTLSFTGLYIGDPFIHATSSKQFIMGWIRFIHFTAAYTLLMNNIVRLYWAFAGNKYTSIANLFPFSPKKLGDLAEDIKTYLFIGDREKCSVGHTALGGLSYLVLMTAFAFMIISGFAMYSVTHTGAIWILLGGWLLGSMDLQTIRLYHHLLMYGILVYAMVHVYIVWFTSSKECNSTMTSMFTGNKFVTKKDLE